MLGHGAVPRRGPSLPCGPCRRWLQSLGEPRCAEHARSCAARPASFCSAACGDRVHLWFLQAPWCPNSCSSSAELFQSLLTAVLPGSCLHPGPSRWHPLLATEACWMTSVFVWQLPRSATAWRDSFILLLLCWAVSFGGLGEAAGVLLGAGDSLRKGTCRKLQWPWDVPRGDGMRSEAPGCSLEPCAGFCALPASLAGVVGHISARPHSSVREAAGTPVWISPGISLFPLSLCHLCAARWDASWGLSHRPGGANGGGERGASRAPTSPLPCPSPG